MQAVKVDYDWTPRKKLSLDLMNGINMIFDVFMLKCGIMPLQELYMLYNMLEAVLVGSQCFGKNDVRQNIIDMIISKREILEEIMFSVVKGRISKYSNKWNINFQISNKIIEKMNQV